jgi:NADP-dependent 3-hydroxy acid dehydrogenase YdfG
MYRFYLIFCACILFYRADAKVVNGKWVEEVLPTTVLITGCSSGIGLATALEFAKNPKFKVWATMRNTSSWKDVVVPSNVIVLPLDVTSDESVTNAVNTILQTDTKIDIVVNNAGYGMVGTLETVHIEEAKKMFDVNVWGVVRVLQAVLPSMRKNKQGHVIGVSSTSGIRATPANEFYAGSKFALEGISEAMRYSLAAFNISVTNVNPGPVV